MARPVLALGQKDRALLRSRRIAATLVLLGGTGDGKSALVNYIANFAAFVGGSPGMKSCVPPKPRLVVKVRIGPYLVQNIAEAADDTEQNPSESELPRLNVS